MISHLHRLTLQTVLYPNQTWARATRTRSLKQLRPLSWRLNKFVLRLSWRASRSLVTQRQRPPWYRSLPSHWAKTKTGAIRLSELAFRKSITSHRSTLLRNIHKTRAAPPPETVCTTGTMATVKSALSPRAQQSSTACSRRRDCRRITATFRSKACTRYPKTASNRCRRTEPTRPRIECRRRTIPATTPGQQIVKYL